VSIPTQLPIGTELLGYRIEALLGRGGMGTVYLAQDLRLRRKVALKLLLPELARDERFRERLLAESKLAASLDHPNIVPIYEAGETDEQIFISMRYVEGEDLKTTLREGALSPEHALGLVSQIASALDAAHAHGLVHRDVKPSNVLIAPQAGHEGGDHVYLADFGLTKRVSDGDGSSQPEQLMGTLDYVAPEQIRGDDVDGRADLYSLGCLLYECLRGEPPYPRGSDAAALFAHLQEEPPTVPGLERVLQKALAKERDDRYQTCRQLVEAARAELGLGRSRRARRFAAIILIGGTAAAATLLALLLGGGGGSGASTATGRLIRIDPRTNRATKTLELGEDPTGVAFGAGGVWMTSLPDSTIWRVDPKTYETKRISTSGTPVGIAVKSGITFGQPVGSAVPGGIVFVAGSGGVTMVDPGSGQQTGVIRIGDTQMIAGGRNAIWAVAGSPDLHQSVAYKLTDVAYGVGRVQRRIPIDPAQVVDEANVRTDEAGIAVGEDGVWVLGDAVDRRLWKIDTRTSRIRATIQLPFAPGGVASGLGGVWVTAQSKDGVARIDPGTGQIIATIRVGRAPWGVAVGAGSVWVANTIDRTISRIDPSSNRVVATIRVDANPKQVAVGGGGVWATANAR
jgi:YVTN family beta-propeller protein